MDDFNEMLASIGINNTWEGYHGNAESESRESVEEEVVNTASSEEYHENIGEGRDLDTEEDADWDAAISSGYISPVDVVDVEEDSEGHQFSVHRNVQPEESSQEVHFHMPDGEIIDVPIVEETTSANLSEDDISDILAENGFNPEVSEAYDELMNAIDEAETDSLEDGTQEETTEPTVEVTTTGRNLIEEPVEEPQEDANNLPLNSPTLLIDDSTSRFSGAEWYNEIQKKRIIIAGLGGIGSWCVLQLARMAPASIFMYDDDNVEIVNMAGQLYSMDDIGKSKVDAMENMLFHYTSAQNIFAIKEKFTSSTEAGDIMICGFDNMTARRTFFDAWQKHVFSLPEEDWHKCLFLDGRLSMTDLQVLCVTGDNAYAMTEYRDKYLFSDDEAEHTVCSMKQTTYLACMIGSIMVNLFTNFVANSLNPIIPYDLPFFTGYDAQNMIFKTEK